MDVLILAKNYKNTRVLLRKLRISGFVLYDDVDKQNSYVFC
jgi:hypothetical protein